MTDETQNTPDPKELEAQELEALRKRADLMNLDYDKRLGLEKMRKLVNDALKDDNEQANNDEQQDAEPAKEKVQATVVNQDGSKETKEIVARKETKGERKARLRKEASKLVRVRIVCMDPNRREHEGEIVCAGNSVVGYFQRYVHFGADDGWHVEQIILNTLKAKKCQLFKTVKGPRGQKVRQGYMAPAYNIEILPDLTAEELDDLAKQQAVGQSID